MFQGESGTLEGLLQHTASVTSTLADRDEVISDLIVNLNEVLDHVGDRDEQLSRLISSFRTLVGGLKDDRQAILGSLDEISDLSVETSDLLSGIRRPFVKDIKQLRAVAGNIDKNKAELDRALQVLPIKLEKVGRTAIYGSWFNFYLCEFQGRVKLPGDVRPVPVYELTPRPPLPPVRSRDDEIPFRERNPVVIGFDQPVALGLLLTAALRADDLPLIGGGRHLPRRLHRVRRAQEGRRGPHRRRPRRQGRRGGPRRRPGRGHLQGRPRRGLRPRHPRRHQGQDAPRAPCSSPSSRPAPASSTEGSTIPVERTSSPYDVVDAFEGLADTTDQIDTDQLAGALTTLADLTRNTPEEFRAALDGVTRLSANVAAKDQQINELLVNLDRVAGGPRRARRGHRRPDARRRRPVPGAGGPPGGDPRPARVDLDAVARADPAGPAEPCRPRAGPDAPGERRRPCSTRTRTTSTTACG